MKKSTLLLAFSVADEMGIDLEPSIEVAITAAQFAEYGAACAKSTSGTQPDWAAPWSVSQERMENAMRMACEKLKVKVLENV